MITREDHVTAKALLDAGTWKLERGLFRTIEIATPGGARELLEAMKLRQVLDNLHHAPACPANHYHRARLVFQRCTCGATCEMRDGATSPPLRQLAKPDAEPPAVADAAEGATDPTSHEAMSFRCSIEEVITGWADGVDPYSTSASLFDEARAARPTASRQGDGG